VGYRFVDGEPAATTGRPISLRCGCRNHTR
jgi:hypothetical protein